VSPEGWDRIRTLFHAALELPEPDRRDFLRARCGEDRETLAEVEALLAADRGAAEYLATLAERSRRLAALPPPPNPASPGAGSVGPTLAPGTLVSHYEIEALLGSGGMGVVYRARDVRLQRTVALKFLPPWLAGAGHARERFLAEARAAAGLEHPNICPIYEIGKTRGGQLFIVMAHVEGESLRDRIARGPLPPRRAVEIAARIARALGCAHAHGIVHRDVKPENVMVDAGGRVKLVDFGIAKLADAAPASPGATRGTWAYMSPEQVRRGDVDPRTDLWALGVVLYEMLAGRRPFCGESHVELAHAITHDAPPPLRTLRPGLRADLERVVMRALARDAGRRYQTAGELEDALRTHGAGRSGRPPMARTAVMAALLVAAGLLGWREYFARGRAAEPPRAAAATVRAAGAAPARSVAVLPLTDQSGKPEDRYFSDGLSEDLIIALSQSPELRVIGRESSFRFRSGDLDSRAIGEKLRVAHLLEGSVTRMGDQVRLRAELVRTSDGSTIWSKSYDRPYRNLFALQDELAAAVARALQARLLGGEHGGPGPTDRPPSGSLEAYNAYLEGNFDFQHYNEAAFRKAIDHYRRAIELDPSYAAAWAELSYTWIRLGVGYRGGAELRRIYDSADVAATRALALDPNLAAAHRARGAVMGYAAWDWRGAEAEYRRASELAPTSAREKSLQGIVEAILGRLDYALKLKREALATEPLYARGYGQLANVLLGLGRYDEARSALLRGLELQPTAAVFHAWLAETEILRGDTAAARRQALQEPSPSWRRFALAMAYAANGDAVRADSALRMLIARSANKQAYQVADVYALRGDADHTFQWLDRARRQRDPGLTDLLFDPLLLRYRADPRFDGLLREVGLSPRESGTR